MQTLKRIALLLVPAALIAPDGLRWTPVAVSRDTTS